MKKNKSVTKKIVSMTAGGVLLASLYANAVYVPRNNQATDQELERQAQTILAGQVEFVEGADGFKVTEREVAQSGDTVVDEVAALVEVIEKLESQVEKQAAVSTVESGVVRAAYSSGDVKQTAQTAQPTEEEIAEAARQISALSGLPQGQTIGSLASILADPFLSAAAVQLVATSAAPGGIAAAISNGGGISSGGVAVLALLGVQSVGGVGGAASGLLGGAVGAVAGAAAGGSTQAPSSP
jgi:hypothetical protein